MKVAVKFDDRDIVKGIAALQKKFPAAVKRSVSRTATSVRVVAAKAMRKDTGLPAFDAKDELKVVLSTEREAARLVQTGNRIPLIKFGARGREPSGGKGRGVSYRLPGGRSRVSNAFIAKMGTGHRGVFVRREKARLPIKELWGPSLVRVFEKLLPELADLARETLTKNLKHEISYALSKEK